MNKKIYIGMLAACLATMGVNAQQQSGKELNKEITLEKDFVPVEKKVTKKNTLPKVKKVTPPAKTTLDYSTTPVDIDVPTTIPTMMPYGYRTAHNFSNKRGYLEVGGGVAANFDGSAGYRIVDTDNTQAGIWVQHNSTWAGKNRTPLIAVDDLRAKQVFNDNRGGLYLTNQIGTAGTLSLDAGVHFDSFNYYGMTMDALTAMPAFDPEKKQTFLEFGINGKWNGKLNVKDTEVGYRVNVGFNHAGYNMVPSPKAPNAKGAGENIINLGIGGDYTLAEYGVVSLDLKGDFVNFKGAKDFTAGPCAPDTSYFVFTAAPRYKWENDVFRAEAGVDLLFGNLHLCDRDVRKNGSFHIAPVVKIDVDIVDGAAIYVDLKGGNRINSLSYMASVDRYSNPLGIMSNSWNQIDGEAGFKIGPFAGFSAKLFGGYGMTEGALVHNTRVYGGGTPVDLYAVNDYFACKMRGFKLGAEFNYKYRSLFDVAGAVTYAPADDTLKEGWTSGYCLGLDGAQMLANLNVKVTPIAKLAVDLGMDYRGKRRTYYDLGFVDMSDAFNLHAGASWRFDKLLTVWVKGSNLLNRRYDIMPGQGAQGINAMGGVSLVF